ncbi:MAG: FecR domain-containing protein, partial [Planctomycetota bacterium]
MHRERCEDLLDQWIEGDLSEVGVHELNDILRLDSALVRDACDRLAEHRLLGLLHRPFDVDAFTDSIISAAEAADQVAINATVDAIDSGTSSGQPITNENLRHDRRSGLKKAAASQFRLPIGLVAIAVSIFCIMLGIDVVRRDFRYLSANTINAQQIVATLVLEEDCQWQGEQLIEGQRLSQGDLLLNSGVAVVRFDGGAEVIARGECSLELLSAGSVSLKFGDIIVRVSEVAMGFRVSTPSSEMIDLGTEFSVNVDGEGETKLNVLEGEVSIRPRALESQQTHLLSEGCSVVVLDGKAS